MRWSQHGDIDFIGGYTNKTAIQIFPLPIVLKLNSHILPNTGQGVSGSHDVLFPIDIDRETRCCFVAKLHTKCALKCVGWNHDVCLTCKVNGVPLAARPSACKARFDWKVRTQFFQERALFRVSLVCHSEQLLFF